MTVVAKVSDEAITQEVNGETVILDLKSEQYFSLDSVGTRVWQLIRDDKSIESITEQMLCEYDTDEITLMADVKQLVESLVQEGLVTLVESGE